MLKLTKLTAISFSRSQSYFPGGHDPFVRVLPGCRSNGADNLQEGT